jgi:hypothetical protein
MANHTVGMAILSTLRILYARVKLTIDSPLVSRHPLGKPNAESSVFQRQGEKSVLSSVEEDFKKVFTPQQQLADEIRPRIPYYKPDHLWRMAPQEAELAEVVNFGHDHQSPLGCIAVSGWPWSPT